MALTKEERTAAVEAHRLHDRDTGSSEVQISILTKRITSLTDHFKANKKAVDTKSSIKILDGFPLSLEGDLLFCHQDNVNTDLIYPGKYTYNDDITPDQQAEVAMENYDPDFTSIAKEGDIFVGGFNFGSGSSREQAATCLKYKGPEPANRRSSYATA